ncbi:efflux RND transporter periplasmic adaptor subunit [Candidatus Electronema sp. PJ]|uniref:efflux RND transporter periplasmic adaptor subunit n=1 Tax=Candidatus Electronema sp. PJ TaxID=3401572 RepID=UPI003AA7D457
MRRSTQFLAAACGLFLLLMLPGCKEEKSNAKQPAGQQGKTVIAAVFEAKLVEVPIFHEAVGTVRAEATGVIAARTMGTVNEVKVREGDRVKQGDLLLIIGDSQLSDRIKQAEAAEREAKEAVKAASAAKEAANARADIAGTTLQRQKELTAKQVGVQQNLDQAAAAQREATASRSQADKAIQAAMARLAQAEAAVRIVKADSGVLAPYDGVVTARLIQAGSLANPGTPLLTIEKTEAFRADVSVPDSLAGKIKAGDELRVAVPDLIPEPFAATVLAVEPTADPKTRTFIIQVKLPHIENLRSGLFVRAYIPNGTTKTFRAPAAALVRYGQLTGLFVLDKHGRARFRMVRPGATVDNGQIDILAGLQEGDRFIPIPKPELADGDLIEVAQ